MVEHQFPPLLCIKTLVSLYVLLMFANLFPVLILVNYSFNFRESRRLLTLVNLYVPLTLASLRVLFMFLALYALLILANLCVLLMLVNLKVLLISNKNCMCLLILMNLRVLLIIVSLCVLFDVRKFVL